MSLGRYLENKRRSITFSQCHLKIIAMFTMLIDHIGLVLIRNGTLYGYDAALYANAIKLPEAAFWLFLYRLMRVIGRLSFPIFAFLIVEGFRKTSNIFKYMLRILLLAIVSEIPYDMMVFNRFGCFDVQNVLFTYFFGLLMLVVIHLISSLPKALTLFMVLIFGSISWFLKLDYGIEGILLIYVFYMFRNDLSIKCLLAIIITFVASFPTNFGSAALSIIFIYFYDGQKGYFDLKRFPYLFYPLHMIILYAILFFSYIKK